MMPYLVLKTNVSMVPPTSPWFKIFVGVAENVAIVKVEKTYNSHAPLQKLVWRHDCLEHKQYDSQSKTGRMDSARLTMATSVAASTDTNPHFLICMLNQ